MKIETIAPFYKNVMPVHTMGKFTLGTQNQ